MPCVSLVILVLSGERQQIHYVCYYNGSFTLDDAFTHTKRPVNYSFVKTKIYSRPELNLRPSGSSTPVALPPELPQTLLAVDTACSFDIPHFTFYSNLW